MAEMFQSGQDATTRSWPVFIRGGTANSKAGFFVVYLLISVKAAVFLQGNRW
jgi:hypothetical protein